MCQPLATTPALEFARCMGDVAVATPHDTGIHPLLRAVNRVSMMEYATRETAQAANLGSDRGVFAGAAAADGDILSRTSHTSATFLPSLISILASYKLLPRRICGKISSYIEESKNTSAEGALQPKESLANAK
ncbi:hypothetical protein KCU92_g286, partial [Aureobasidium melanogenum]